MKMNKASKLGLTLIEVLIALVILTVGVCSLLPAMAKCLATVGVARKRDVARALIMRVDIENPIESEDLEEMSDSGEFEDYDGYEWFRDIQMVDEEERPGLFEVNLRVQWSERGRDAFEEVVMYRYAPNAESVTSRP